MQKSKWQQYLDAPKGCMEYNPNQSFALHVYWVVRSPTAASDMIEKGFAPCSQATLRDTPTTLTYFFRISRDQRLAQNLKDEVKTIGQHPHYQSAFKSIEMGLPRSTVEMKLKLGGIDISPLSWDPNEPISGHELALDFDPIVLECTEVYLDTRSFYEHSMSREWMKYSTEILKASRSLKPTTYSLGNPSADIWEKCLEPSLKAVHINSNNDSEAFPSGVFFQNFPESEIDTINTHVFFLEIDLVVSKTDISQCRHDLFSAIQSELRAPCVIILPIDIDTCGTGTQDEDETRSYTIRLMASFPYSSNTVSLSLGTLKTHCEKFEGRIISFDSNYLDYSTAEGSQPPIAPEEEIQLSVTRINATRRFLDASGELASQVSILDGHEAAKANQLAGYPLHHLYPRLIRDETIDFKV